MANQERSNPITIVQGDAVHTMRRFESESVDLIVADPPYNLGKNYGNNQDQLGFDAYIQFSRDWLSEAHRVLRGDGTLYVFMGVRFISYLYDILERDLGFHFNSWICWHYTQGLGRTRGFSPRHDDILMFTKSKQFNFYLDNVRIPQKYYRARNNMRGANPGDVWKFSHVHYCNENRQAHPTQKPEGLLERMVLASSKENDIVLDPFIGSGTTARVCQQLNRRCIGIELNPAFVAQTHRRLREPFSGFDSIDGRMSRIPHDLNDVGVRQAYTEDHKRWFLPHHPEKQSAFDEAIRKKYEGQNQGVGKGTKK